MNSKPEAFTLTTIEETLPFEYYINNIIEAFIYIEDFLEGRMKSYPSFDFKRNLDVLFYKAKQLKTIDPKDKGYIRGFYLVIKQIHFNLQKGIFVNKTALSNEDFTSDIKVLENFCNDNSMRFFDLNSEEKNDGWGFSIKDLIITQNSELPKRRRIKVNKKIYLQFNPDHVLNDTYNLLEGYFKSPQTHLLEALQGKILTDRICFQYDQIQLVDVFRRLPSPTAYLAANNQMPKA